MEHLLPHQLRVVEELKDLTVKIEKLQKFLETSTFENLCDEEQLMLEDQLRWMEGYAEALDSRVVWFYNKG